MSIERISTIQTASVITQPTDVVEHLTLIEKLEQEKEWWDEVYIACDLDRQEIRVMIDDAINGCINIVKQHQTWRKMPSDEKPQDMQVCNLLVKNESEESPTLYDIGLYREYKGEDVWLCMTRPEEHIDPSKILAWQPMNEPSNDFFESLEQPPSEVQDD